MTPKHTPEDRPTRSPIQAFRLKSASVVVLLWAMQSTGAASPGVDDHTVALWLFDEPNYPNVILTDAGPFGYDLRLEAAYGAWWLQTGGKGEPPAKPLHIEGKYGLIEGRFGRALHVPDTTIARVIWPDNRQRYSSAPVHADFLNVPERFNLGYLDWTIEFWFKAEGPQPDEATLFELRNESDHPRAMPMENALRLAPGRGSFVLTSRKIAATRAPFSLELQIPTDSRRLNDGAWHHLAFSYSAGERQIRHYVDGRLQQLPANGGFMPMPGVLAHFSVGANLKGRLDEYRISDVARYPGEFPPPASFSRTHNPGTRTVNRPDGPPLLFADDRDPAAPLQLGSRKHVLIDGALVDSLENLAFRPQPPRSRQVTDFRNTESWEPSSRMGPTIPDVFSVWDDGGELRMLYANNGMWSGKQHVICLATSKDGLKWEKPALNLHSWEGRLATNIVLPMAGKGTLIKDPNPACLPADRYKLVVWTYYRGFYLYTSPDGVHFTRNETVGFPFDSDGSTTFFWDDQRGLYQAYFRAVSENVANRRRTGHAMMEDIFQPWPFQPAEWPWIDDLVLARPARGELPIIDTGGQVYRIKAHKYEWAPDVYLAFPWRYDPTADSRPGSFLMVSRDGENWTRYEDPYYFPGGWKLDGREVREALMEHGMVRRGDEVWQFGTARFTEHAGALYGAGEEEGGGTHDRLLRLVQRLDGFVAVAPAEAARAGVLVTKPFTFAGGRLELNIDASGGSARIELQDAGGIPIPGFTLAASVPLRENDTAAVAAWSSSTDLSSLAGRPVRLKVELIDASLFAFQFQ